MMRKILVALAFLALAATALAGEPKIVETSDKIVVEYTGNGDGVQNVPVANPPAEVANPAPAQDPDTPPAGYLAKKKWLQQRMATQGKGQ